MPDPKIGILTSPLTDRTDILAPGRASRGGLTSESMEEKIEKMKSYWNLSSVPCDSGTFLGLPYIEGKPCVLAPNKEEGTTREYARVAQNGKLKVHLDFIFPGQNGWVNEPWNMRVIDNMFPLTDRIDFISGYVYGNHRDVETIVETMDAKGKDFVVVLSPSHIVPAYLIDFERLALIEQIFTRRELEDPDIKYVIAGSNNPGLTRKVLPYFMKKVDIGSLEEAID